MKQLPDTENALVLRTDFSNDDAWRAVQESLRKNSEVLPELFEFIDDTAYAGISAREVLALAPEEGELSFVMLADDVTMASPDQRLLVVDLFEEPGRTFRTVPKAALGVGSNLSIANLDFADYADHLDGDGVFHGF